jgi:hypothetical protein
MMMATQLHTYHYKEYGGHVLTVMAVMLLHV